MKQSLRTIFILWFAFFLPLSLKAEESATISLQLPPQFFSQVCPIPLWQSLRAQWLGTTDRRADPQVGLETKKGGKDPIAVTVSPSLADLFDKNLRELFARCGMNLVPEVSNLKIGAAIEEFYADVEKGILIGKGKARSRLVLNAEGPGGKVTSSVGYEIEFKKTRKKSLQRLTETLNELFAKTLEQIPLSPQLRTLGEGSTKP